MRSSSLVRFSALVLVSTLALVGCGDDGQGTATQTPYGQSPYAQTPYGTSGSTAGWPAELAAEVEAAMAKARVAFLAQQEESGAWGDPELKIPANVGHTAMATSAVIAATSATQVRDDPNIGKALAWLAAQQKDDGSIWDNPQFVNYMTSAAAGALAMAKVGSYRNTLVDARGFLADSQIAGDENDLSYGGFPYKQDQGQDADLSNLQFAAQALADAGLEKDHVVWQRMQTYLNRVQNRSESNVITVPVEIDGKEQKVVSGDDGGAGYGPGQSKAGYLKRSDGTFEARSYGSMTYALLKCMLLAGVDVDDARVVAALEWISRNFVLDRNPGFESSPNAEEAGQQGWYYYVYTLARTLGEVERAMGKPLVVKSPDGTKHNWRAALARAILDRRRDDGLWVNEVERWEEASPILASSYAMVALAEASGRLGR